MKKYSMFFLITFMSAIVFAGAAAIKAAAPANDNLANTQILGNGKIGEVAGTNLESTVEAGEPIHFSPMNPLKSVWYSWTAPENMSMSFEVNDNFKSVIGVYKTSAANPAFADLTNIANNCDMWGFTNDKYRVTFVAESGKTYYIAVAGWTEVSNEGNFHLKYYPHRLRYSMKFHGYNQKSVAAVYRPGEGSWYLNGTSSPRILGLSSDVPMAFDYDGNGISDFITVRNENGRKVWYLNPSSSLGFYYTELWGLATDKISFGDFDRDGKADLVAIRTEGQNLVWYVRQSRGNSLRAFVWGIPDDKPVIGDFDGDGATDVAVTRSTPNGLVWYILKSGFDTANPTYSQYTSLQFGINSDLSVVEDYDGDGKSDVAVFRPSNGIWYIFRSGTNEVQATPFGSAGDKPQSADYDGDGKADLAVFRPSTGDWYFWYSGTDTQSFLHWGNSTDTPVVAPHALSQQ